MREYYKVPAEDWLMTSNGKVRAYQRAALAEPEKGAESIAEYVGQWVLAELISTYKYPPEWLGDRIVVEEVVPVATADKDADISIKTDGQCRHCRRRPSGDDRVLSRARVLSHHGHVDSLRQLVTAGERRVS